MPQPTQLAVASLAVVPGAGPNLPPLGLSVEVTLADGTRKCWDSNAKAADRPQGLQFRTRQGDGFSDASCTLARRIDTDYIDLNLLDDVAFIGDDGATAYEGRVMGIPRSVGDMHTVSVNCAGWMAHARDRKFTEVYVDRDFGAWGDSPLANRNNVLANPAQFGTSAVSIDNTGAALVQTLVGPWGAAGGIRAQSWYDAGPNNTVGGIYYSYAIAARTANGGNWLRDIHGYQNDDTSGTSVTTGNLAAAGTGELYFAFTTPLRYALAQHGYTVASATADQYELNWKQLVVFGSHGLTRRGSPTDPAGGLWASEVITNIASRFCPELNTSGVQATSYPIPHLVFKDPTDPYDAFLDINKFHLWDLGVWENKTLTFRPYDLSDYDWEVRLSDFGVTVDLHGDATDDLANGIAINYTDVATGRAGRITPLDDTTLKDTSTDNPVNTHGLTKWTEFTLSSPTTAAAALQIGRIALAEFNLPKAPGTITVTGHIKDRAGHWQQGWCPRAGDTISITDHPNDRPRLITETNWEHDTKTLTISVEGPAHRLDAVLDRITTSLTAANLSN